MKSRNLWALPLLLLCLSSNSLHAQAKFAIYGTVGGEKSAIVNTPWTLAGTAGFYVGYRLAEDYLLVPRIMGRTVQVPGVISVLAVLVGGALMAIIGALVAIPTAAAIRLLLHEVAFRRLDTS